MRVRGRVVHGLFTQGQVDKGGKDIAWTAIPLTRYVVMYCNNTGAVNLEPIRFLYLVVLMFRFVLYGHPLAPSPPSTLTECHLQGEARWCFTCFSSLYSFHSLHSIYSILFLLTKEQFKINLLFSYTHTEIAESGWWMVESGGSIALGIIIREDGYANTGTKGTVDPSCGVCRIQWTVSGTYLGIMVTLNINLITIYTNYTPYGGRHITSKYSVCL